MLEFIRTHKRLSQVLLLLFIVPSFAFVGLEGYSRMSDDNVVFENSTAFAAEMQKHARPFEMMFYPGYTHRVAGPGISEHLWTTILDFLDREVKNKPLK